MEKGNYRDLFLSEGGEILKQMNNTLVLLEKNPKDKDFFNEIFRHAHTLKGMASTMGYQSITQLSHAAEEILALFRERKLKPDKETLNLLFEVCDVLEILLEQVASGDEKLLSERTQIDPIIQKLERLTLPKERKKKEKKNEIQEALKKGGTLYQVVLHFSPECAFKEPRALVAIKEIAQMGTVIGSEFLLPQIKEGRLGQELPFFFVSEYEASEIQKNLALIQDLEKVTVEAAAVTEKKAEKASMPEPNEKAKGEMIRVSLDQLDSVMNLVGELLIHRVRLSALLKEMESPVVSEAIGRFEQVTQQLQNEMLQLRLIPMDYIFNRFPRMIRDLAFAEKKQVNLIIEGGEIGLDRTILDKINEPLIHLLRNAVTHGMEQPEQRTALGKSKEGFVKVSARRERHFVVIEVSDDGNGMDVEKIRRTAVERNLISLQEAKGLSEEEVIRLISLPGFTTTPIVTAASGRGMGMHTVKTVVESCGGTLKIEATPHIGSTFTLKLPVTMAIVPSLLVQIQKETYVIPLVNVLEIIKVEAHLPKRVENNEMIPYREGLLSLVRLEEKLGRKGFKKESTDADQNGKSLSVAVVEVGHRKAGLVVDQFLGQQEVVIKALSDRLKTVKGLSGATILADGKVAPILDLGSVL